jgi:hypothetical protein
MRSSNRRSTRLSAGGSRKSNKCSGRCGELISCSRRAPRSPMMNWKERSGNGIHVSVHGQPDPDFLALSSPTAAASNVSEDETLISMRWLAGSVLRNEARRWGDKSTAGVDDFNSFSKVFNYARLENITTCPDVEARSHEFDFFMDRKEDDFCAARSIS